MDPAQSAIKANSGTRWKCSSTPSRFVPQPNSQFLSQKGQGNNHNLTPSAALESRHHDRNEDMRHPGYESE
jgi:hypothetical protein